jgi:hypothetical protein
MIDVIYRIPRSEKFELYRKVRETNPESFIIPIKFMSLPKIFKILLRNKSLILLILFLCHFSTFIKSLNVHSIPGKQKNVENMFMNIYAFLAL